MNLIPFPPMKRSLIAILRGLKPEEAEGVVSVLIEIDAVPVVPEQLTTVCVVPI